MRTGGNDDSPVGVLHVARDGRGDLVAHLVLVRADLGVRGGRERRPRGETLGAAGGAGAGAGASWAPARPARERPGQAWAAGLGCGLGRGLGRGCAGAGAGAGVGGRRRRRHGRVVQRRRGVHRARAAGRGSRLSAAATSRLSPPPHASHGQRGNDGEHRSSTSFPPVAVTCPGSRATDDIPAQTYERTAVPPAVPQALPVDLCRPAGAGRHLQLLHHPRPPIHRAGHRRPAQRAASSTKCRWPSACSSASRCSAASARYGMRELLNSGSRRVETDLRDHLFRHLQRMSAEFYDRYPTGDLMARATNDLLAVRMVAGPALMYLVDTIIRALLIAPAMAAISPRLTLLALLPAARPAGGHGRPRPGDPPPHRWPSRPSSATSPATPTRTSPASASSGPIGRSRRRSPTSGRLNEEYLGRNMSLARVQGLSSRCWPCSAA